VLGPTEYATIRDETKGHVTVYVGPQKTSLSNTDQPVVFDPRLGTFVKSDLDGATKVFPTADESSYIVLSNPAVTGSDSHPKTGSNMSSKLDIGRKINVPGPTSFPLWPGQTAVVIPGHRLRSNEYLMVRVYNDAAATENWSKAVMKPQAAGSVAGDQKAEKATEVEVTEASPPVQAVRPQLTMGQLLVIKGTEVSFFIPPTGMEVVPDTGGQYVRNAVTLEQLDYCILLDENGKSRYVIGPAVVFPEPTEIFVELEGSRKFRARELNENMALYLKVIAPYTDEHGQRHEAGEELFISGKEQKLYYPRPEHSILKYGEEEVHFAVAIPEGEGRYALDKRTGEVPIVRGPKMFLADPRHQSLVRRIIDVKDIQLWYPASPDAVVYNQQLAALTRGKSAQFVAEGEVTRKLQATSTLSAIDELAHRGIAGPSFERRSDFTPPRTITLDTKFEGVPAINVWTGYAVQIVSKTGKRRVVIGPATELLEFNETLEVLEMSTGTPKTDKTMKTVYLRVLNNKVSDLVKGETGDLVQVSVTLSYRVNFEGNPEKWFAVENYVKLLVEHLRSMIRNAIKQHGIEEFNAKAIAIIRDTVLGVSEASEGEDAKSRPGRLFEENGMRVYDVEILDVAIGDNRIATLLTSAQHESVQSALQVAAAERGLKVTRRLQEISQQTAMAEAETQMRKLDLAKDQAAQELVLELARLTKEAGIRVKKLETETIALEKEGELAEGRRAINKADADQKLALSQAQQTIEIEKLRAEVQAVVDKANAFGPEVVVALQAFADKDLAARACESMSPLSILGGKSVVEIFKGVLGGTVLEGMMKVAGVNGGGSSQSSATSRV